jgi:hypothetical protein
VVLLAKGLLQKEGNKERAKKMLMIISKSEGGNDYFVKSCTYQL